MKITSYFCDLCGSAIPTELVDDVKGLNIRVDLDHGAYESFVFQHACLSCRISVRTVLVEWRDKDKKGAPTRKVFVGWAYLLARYDTINWAASYSAAGFALEALFLVWTGLIRNSPSLRPRRDMAGAAGLCIFVFALIAWPLVGRLFGRPWLQAEIF